MMSKTDRRIFLRRAAVFSSAAMAATDRIPHASASETAARGVSTDGLPDDWLHIRKIDVHMHVSDSTPPSASATADAVIEAANALGIEKLCISRPTSKPATPAEVRKSNDVILGAMQRYPNRFLGYCFLIAGHEETLPELDRCLDAGMIGVKLYNQYKYTDPVVFPIIERCIDARVPILGHAGHVCDERTRTRQPNISDASVFCALSERYPEAMLIHGHVHGGGDWEWTIKRLRDCPNVYLDTSGSVLDDRTIEMAVEVLGHKRILFGTDISMETGVGKILSARITPEQRADIFSRNMQAILDQRKS